MFGCLGKLIALALVLVVAVALWIFREPLLERARGAFGREEAPPTSLELADRATGKIERLVGGESRMISLSEEEVQALLQNRLRTFLPTYVLEPSIELDGERVVMSARLPVDEVPQLRDELGPAAGFLPDTTAVSASGHVIPYDETHVALAFDEMSVARVPLPKRMIPNVVARLRRSPQPDLPPDALALPLPAGVRAAYVRADSLVLVAGEPRAPTR